MMQLNETLAAALEAAQAERAKLDTLINGLMSLTGAAQPATKTSKVTHKVGRKGWSEAAKKAASKRMKAYWAARTREG